MKTMPGTIEPATARDALAIARVHRRGLPGAFLSSLGTPFLTAMYASIGRDPAGFTFVAREGSTVVGFAMGALDATALVARNRFPAGVLALPYLVRKGTLARAMSTSNYDVAADLPAPELLAIAVVPSARRAGLGAALARRLFGALREAGARESKVIVGRSNETANLFYASLGLTLARSITVRDEESNVWIHWRAPA